MFARLSVLAVGCGLIVSVLTGFVHRPEVRMAPGVHGLVEVTTPMGGWPIAYLHDRLGSSVVGDLDVIIDVFEWREFVFNTFVWTILIGIAIYAWNAVRKQKRQ